MEKILVIDDDKKIVEAIMSALPNDHYTFLTDYTGNDTLAIIEEHTVSVVLLDVFLGENNGLTILFQIRERFPEVNVVMISGESDIEIAVKAIQYGAFDFLEKPLNRSKLEITVKNALADYSQKKQNQHFKNELLEHYRFCGTSDAIQSVERIIDKAARSDIAILITGEHGTGKEIAARRLHYKSNRCSGPFVAVNCAAIPSELLESELFGHKKGAFTGAHFDKEGLFTKANDGTLFLDEIGDMPVALQAKLLRVLQEKEVLRIGDTEVQRVNIRVVSATNRSIQTLVSSETFRQDLFYRLNTLHIELPTLRSRAGDIPALTKTFLKEFCFENNIPLPVIGDTAMDELSGYSFPGNVRELKSIVQRTVILLDSPTIVQFVLPQDPKHTRNNDRIEGQLLDVKRTLLRGYLRERLHNLHGDKNALADELSIHVNNVHRLLKEP
jgi:DNA-binding NtrC family response regulator